MIENKLPTHEESKEIAEQRKRELIELCDFDQKQYLQEIPQRNIRILLEAWHSNSMSKAIKAKCLDCCCWNLSEARSCMVKTCPLWKHRKV